MIRIFQSLLNAKACSRSLQLAVGLCGKHLKCHGREINSTLAKFEYAVDADEDGEEWCLLNLVSKNSSFSLYLHFAI